MWVISIPAALPDSHHYVVRHFRPNGRQPLRVSWEDAGSKKMRMLLYVFAFAVIGLAVGLIFRKVRPYEAPPSLWISTLIGVIGSLIGGVVTLIILIRRHVPPYDYSYDHVYSDSYASFPTYWISFVIAVLGAVLALVLNRLLTAKQLDSG